jgi:hypothetical protein
MIWLGIGAAALVLLVLGAVAYGAAMFMNDDDGRPTPREPVLRINSPLGVLYVARLDHLLMAESYRSGGSSLRPQVFTLELIEQRSDGRNVQVLGTYHAFDFPRASE